MDWSNLVVLARYLLYKPDLARVTVLNAESKTSRVLTLDGYTDSDWGRCLDSRRSTDCTIINVGGTIVIAHAQTQPGTPAASSGEAETRALSRGARDAMFFKQLAEEDFGLKLGTARLWTDATTALQTASRARAVPLRGLRARVLRAVWRACSRFSPIQAFRDPVRRPPVAQVDRSPTSDVPDGGQQPGLRCTNERVLLDEKLISQLNELMSAIIAAKASMEPLP